MKTYGIQLRDRKLELRLRGWKEIGHRARCGYYWVHEQYHGNQFSIHEAERIERRKDAAKQQAQYS